MRHRIRLAIAGLLLLIPAGASAQQIPSSADPGRVEERLRPPSPRPELAPRLQVPSPRAQPAPDEAERVRFRLSGIVVTGATAYDPAAFRPLYEEFLDETVSLATVYEIASRITVMYRNDGYILSQAVVPAQRIAEGIVTIQVVEGFIDNIDIQNDEETDIERLRAYAGKIRASRPLRQRDLERYLLLANDLAGLSVRTVLTPSPETPGAADLTLIVSRDEVQGSAGVDNRGTRYLGPLQATLSATANSVFGQDERITVLHVATPDDKELRFYHVQADIPLGAEGTAVSASVAYTDTAPGFTLESLEVRGASKSVELGANHPVLRSRTENLSLSARFEIHNTRTDIFGDQLLTEDRTRVARVSAHYDSIDGWVGLNSLTGTLSQGLDLLGATETGSANLSRAAGVSDFTKLTLKASRLQHLSDRFSAYIALSGQKSANPLLAAEEFGVGGIGFGSAYDPSEITGDDGVAARAELQYADAIADAPPANYQLYVFYDIGAVWNRDPAAGEPARESLTSAGVGARFAATSWLTGNLEIAKPLTRPVEARGDDGEGWRAFFGLTGRF